MYDVLIIGGGAAGMSCALVLGSAGQREYVENKKIGIIMHQRSSHLQTALFNNVLGVAPETTGISILEDGKLQLKELYPHIDQIEKEKVSGISRNSLGYTVTTNHRSYQSRIVVVAVGYTNLLSIEGLEVYKEPHPRTEAYKNKIWLRNVDHLIEKNLYVAGTLAGWRSQYAIAAGSGAHVATDILTQWNDGKHTKVHDKI